MSDREAIVTASLPVIESQPAAGDVHFLEERINTFNPQATGIADARLLAAFERDATGAIVAGTYGWTWGGCCELRYLWVHEALRRQGRGARLLEAVEAEARRRGCAQVILATHSFQAPAFYAKRGYETLCEIDGYPRGHRQLILRKQLA